MNYERTIVLSVAWLAVFGMAFIDPAAAFCTSIVVGVVTFEKLC